MRRLKTNAPNDPGAWVDVSRMWPTARGTYKTSDAYDSGTALSATGEDSTTWKGAWVLPTLSGRRAYLIGTKPWELDTGISTLTDRSGGASMAGNGFMCQYGDISILCRGTAASLASSSGGNFAAIAGAPSAEIAVVQSNAVVAFNTSTSADGWAASDIGDYTNWTTGEAASGRILEGNGPITAAVPFGDRILVFKRDAIFSMSYVGGLVKWIVQKIVHGIGCVHWDTSLGNRSPAVVCGDVVVFPASGGNAANDAASIWYAFDGVGRPYSITDEYQPPAGSNVLSMLGVPVYDHAENIVSFVTRFGAASGSGERPVFFFNVKTGAWGKGEDITTSNLSAAPILVRGDSRVCAAFFGRSQTLRTAWAPSAGKLYQPVKPHLTGTTSYVKTSKMGEPGVKTQFDRLTPMLRRRTELASPSVSLEMNLYRELHDTTPATTRTITESSARDRFDLLGGAAVDTCADFKVTFTNIDAEVDDLLVGARAVGTD